jgi:hypothetical protein
MAVKYSVRIAYRPAMLNPLALSCKSAHCKADIISSQLCALCSQFRALRECKEIVYAKYQWNF